MPIVAFTCSNMSNKGDISCVQHLCETAREEHAIEDFWFIVEVGGILQKKHVHGIFKMKSIAKRSVERLKAFFVGQYTPFLKFFSDTGAEGEARKLIWYKYCMKDQCMFEPYENGKSFDYYSSGCFRNWWHLRGMILWPYNFSCL